MFVGTDELTPNKSAIVVLHPDTEFNGDMLNVRDYECVYMLGNTKNLPSGSVRINQTDLLELLE